MSVSKEININITGQVYDDWNDNDYAVLVAKIKVICAEYDLEMDEE